MKVLYEPFLRRARNGHSSTPNGSTLEICHPGEFHLPKNDTANNNNNNNNNHSAKNNRQNHVRHIIDYDAITINKELGIGEFGVVQQGK